MDISKENRKILELLAREFPNRRAAFAEIINLQAILNLPKGTEHFLSDLHGEYEAFNHILNNCSGVIRETGRRDSPLPLQADAAAADRAHRLFFVKIYTVQGAAGYAAGIRFHYR